MLWEQSSRPLNICATASWFRGHPTSRTVRTSSSQRFGGHFTADAISIQREIWSSKKSEAPTSRTARHLHMMITVQTLGIWILLCWRNQFNDGDALAGFHGSPQDLPTSSTSAWFCRHFLKFPPSPLPFPDGHFLLISLHSDYSCQWELELNEILFSLWKILYAAATHAQVKGPSFPQFLHFCTKAGESIATFPAISEHHSHERVGALHGPVCIFFLYVELSWKLPLTGLFASYKVLCWARAKECQPRYQQNLKRLCHTGTWRDFILRHWTVYSPYVRWLWLT